MHLNISGRFLAEVTKQVLLDLEASKYQVFDLIFFSFLFFCVHVFFYINILFFIIFLLMYMYSIFSFPFNLLTFVHVVLFFSLPFSFVLLETFSLSNIVAYFVPLRHDSCGKRDGEGLKFKTQ